MLREASGSLAKPRVLICGPVPPPLGGMATFCRSLLDSSLPEQVDLCFVRTGSPDRALSESGRATLSNLLSAFRDCGRFAAAVLRHRPQVSHITTAFGLSFLKHSVCAVIACLLGSRVLLHPHCSIQALYVERSRRWQWFFRQVLRFTDGVIALSSEWDQLRSFAPTCRVFHLPNAVDLPLYRSIAQEHLAQASGSRPLRVLYLGYLGRAKGSFDLVKAARQVLSAGVDVAFNLVGDELLQGERERLQAEIDAAGLSDHVALHPSACGQQKMTFFRNADVFVYPSHHEGMPIAVLEALACALPIVATRVGGLPDLVSDGVNGALVEPGHPDQLATALVKLLIDSGLRRLMQAASYRLATEQHDMEQCVAQLVDVYGATLPNAQAGQEARGSRTRPELAKPLSENTMRGVVRALDAPWKAWNEVCRYLAYPRLRLLFALYGIPWERDWRFYGIPIVQKHRHSSVTFGPGLRLRSRTVSNPLAPNHPVVIATRQPNAVLKVGTDFHMTGGTLCAAQCILIGDRVNVGANTIIVDTDFHPLDPVHRQAKPADGQVAPIVIEDDVFIGMNCLVLKGVTIGAGSVVGAGSVIRRDVPPRVVVAGNPARVVRAF